MNDLYRIAYYIVLGIIFIGRVVYRTFYGTFFIVRYSIHTVPKLLRRGMHTIFARVYMLYCRVSNVCVLLAMIAQVFVQQYVKKSITIIILTTIIYWCKKLSYYARKTVMQNIRWLSQSTIHICSRHISKRNINFIHTVGIILTTAIVGTILIFSVYMGTRFWKSLPSPRDIGVVNYSRTSHLYDRNGKLLYDIYRDYDRTPIHIDDLPAYVYQATIAIEDKNFYHHFGVSPISGVMRAFKDNILHNTGGFQGGSTITQQLVKSALLTPDRTIERKMKEMVLALWTERIYTKKQILEMYLNQVSYGGTAYGIEKAAQQYFGKSAKQLTLDEAAVLAGLPQAPSLYSPFVNPTLAQERRDQVLRAMYEQKYIHKEVFETNVKAHTQFRRQSTEIRAPHFVFYIKDRLTQVLGRQVVEEGGLDIKTTLDLDVQTFAEQTLQEELAKVQWLNISNGAILVTKPATGEIIAMVGSVGYFSDKGAYNVTTALRQPGSTLKPLLYALALERGSTASTVIDDSPFVLQNAYERWVPVNYDGRFHGRVSIRQALANSYNIPAVRVIERLGVLEFINFATRAGIDTFVDPSRYGLSLALGGGEVTMIDMTESFGVLANHGMRVDVNPLIYVVDPRSHTAMIQQENPSEKVLEESTAFIISDILSDNKARVSAFGYGSALEIPGHRVAVKTGTTNDKKDNWTIGYTPEYLVAVWVGNNDNTPMHPYLTSGITGAAPIWNKVMKYLLERPGTNGHKNTWYTQPSTVVSKLCLGYQEYFATGTENTAQCILPPYARPTRTP